jgi:hypothetical protein
MLLRSRGPVNVAGLPQQHRQQDQTDPQPPIPTTLEDLYYNPRMPGSFGGVSALYRASKAATAAADVGNLTRTQASIRNWFETQPAYTLHKPARTRFRRNIILVHGVDEQFQADLADVSMLEKWNNHTHFWLTCIDVLSKYAWVIPLRTKSARNVKAAFEEIFKERKPMMLQTDQGTEFTNDLLRDYMKQSGVHHFFAFNPDIKAAIVERFNRTIKQKVWKYMTHKDTDRYIDILQDMVHSYNNTYHRSIKMTPTEASLPENEKRAWRNLYKDRVDEQEHKKKKKKPVKFKYGVGDYVRISEERGVFRKGYKQRWTEEVFKIVKQSPRDPIVYRLEDLKGEPIIGSFYELEIQRVPKPLADDIDRVLQKHQQQEKKTYTRKGMIDGEKSLEHFAKFRNYPDYDNRFGLRIIHPVAATAGK